jgi:hypothetical protein
LSCSGPNQSRKYLKRLATGQTRSHSVGSDGTAQDCLDVIKWQWIFHLLACPIGFQRRQSARQSSLGLAHRQHEWQLFDQRCSASNHSILAWHVDKVSTRPGGDGRRYDSSNESEISPEVHRRQRAGLHKPCPSSTRVATACSSLQCSCSSSWSSRTISAWSVGTARLDWMGANGQVIRPTNRL